MHRLLSTLLILLATLPGSGLAAEVGSPTRLSDRWTDGDQYMGIRLLGALVLSGDPDLAELSDLAWDADEGLLYGVTDRGLLLHLRPEFNGSRLTGATLLARFPLRGAGGKRLRKYQRDAEGMVALDSDNGTAGDSRLLIAFEGRNQVDYYSPRGDLLGRFPLPAALRDPALYQRRNKGLEALARHPGLGLLTGPELPLDDGLIPIISEQGLRWYYEPFEPDGALVALEVLGDGALLVLERAFTRPYSPWIITLSRIHPTRANAGTGLKAEVLARFDSTDGWRINNFEGLTRYRGKRFFMVTDNGGYSLLETQLLYFEIP